MSFLEKLKNSGFAKWLREIFGITEQKLIPAAIPVENDFTKEVSLSQPKRLNKFEKFKADISESEHFKLLSEKNQIRYLNTIDKLYICMGGKIPRKQPFVLRELLGWHENDKIEHLANISENWTYEYSSEFEKYFSQYKDVIANNVINFETKSALDFIQAHPEEINLDVFPPMLKEEKKEKFVPIFISASSSDAKKDDDDDNPIIKPANYDNYANYLYDTPVKDALALDDDAYIEQLFQELFVDINEPVKADNSIADIVNETEYSFYSETALEQLFDNIFGTEPAKENVSGKPGIEIPIELLSDLKNQAIDQPFAQQ